MIRKNFRLQIILRILLLSLCISLLIVFIQKGDYYLIFFAATMLLLLIYGLFHYIDKVNSNFSDFLSAIKFEDFNFSSRFGEQGESFKKLDQNFRIINDKFLDIRAEKESNHQFLQTLVKQVEIGLLCMNADGEVTLMNPALEKLLGKPYLLNISSLKKIDPRLWETVERLKSGQKELLKLTLKNKVLQLSIQCAEIRLQEEVYRIISFQNIKNELEEQELTSWQKLIRILTHEIMNSVAPISSLSNTLQQILKDKEQLNVEEIAKLQKSISAIERRSEGLLNFTESYRKLTRIPAPNFQRVLISDLFESVLSLLESDLLSAKINLAKSIEPDDLSFQGDPLLMEQVLINLIKNALEAASTVEKAHIKLTATQGPEKEVLIEISDNGPGISEDQLDKIFIPFFTTKKAGSGIGLSLSRQIVRMHQGSLEIQSQKGKGTRVLIRI